MKNLLFVFCALSFISNEIGAQEIKNVSLKKGKAAYALNQFHIISVYDDRGDTGSIGTMSSALSKKKTKINLDGGVKNAISTYIKDNVSQDTNSTAISLHILQLHVSEKMNGILEQTDLMMNVSFYYNNTKLIEYSASEYTKKAGDASVYIESMIRKRIDGHLQEFEKWWTTNKKPYTEKPAVTVNVEIGKISDDTELIVYNKQVILSINDFAGPADELSKADAITYSAISMKYTAETTPGKTTVKVVITPLFDKYKSWCRNGARNSKTLAHEQLHFDITALKACELVDVIRKYGFSSDDYSRELEQLHKQNQKELFQAQNDYDRETDHSNISKSQKEWENKMKKKLAEQNCF